MPYMLKFILSHCAKIYHKHENVDVSVCCCFSFALQNDKLFDSLAPKPPQFAPMVEILLKFRAYTLYINSTTGWFIPYVVHSLLFEQLLPSYRAKAFWEHEAFELSEQLEFTKVIFCEDFFIRALHYSWVLKVCFWYVGYMDVCYWHWAIHQQHKDRDKV